jgi:hypothetical protein
MNNQTESLYHSTEDRRAEGAGCLQRYETPTLARLGTVQELTAGSTGFVPDVNSAGAGPISGP